MSRPPPVGSMTATMLDSLLRDTLDPGYEQAAARRRAAGGTGPRRGTALTVAGVLLFGAIIGVAYSNARAAAPASERTRIALIADVRQESGRSTDLQQRLDDLRGVVSQARNDALAATTEGRTQLAAVQRLESATAAQPVTGPGITVTVSDAGPTPKVDPVTGDPVSAPADEAGVVLDTDLQVIVNALWTAGAEAIAVGDQRLGPTTTIRTAGEAILVDFLPVASPYVIHAIGNPDTLLARFVGSPTAARYAVYHQTYGLGFTTDAATTITLAAASDSPLRYAQLSLPAGTGGTK